MADYEVENKHKTRLTKENSNLNILIGLQRTNLDYMRAVEVYDSHTT